MELAARFPGFRFCPTDEELISHYLKKKIEGLENSVEIVAEVDICKYEPWDLPAKSVIQSDQEWFFFSSGGRKYPNGTQAKRATEVGFWKAMGKERAIKSGNDVIGIKMTLVFHIGRAPKGERTNWIIDEYRIKGHEVDKIQISCSECKEQATSSSSTGNCVATVSWQWKLPFQGLHKGESDWKYLYQDKISLKCWELMVKILYKKGSRNMTARSSQRKTGRQVKLILRG